MPVDIFGRMDGGSAPRVVAGGVTLTQANNTFLRVDGSNPVTGDLDMNGRVIKGLPITNTSEAGKDEALSRGQAIDLITNHDDSPTNNNHLTNKKYVDATAEKYVNTKAIGPVISMYSTATQAIRAETYTKVSFKTDRFDREFNGRIGTTIIEPGKAGCYIVSTHIEFRTNGAVTSCYVYLYKNSGVHMLIAGGEGELNAIAINATGGTIVYLTENDYLEISVYSTTGIVAKDFSLAFLRP